MSGRILVVEDDERIRSSMRLALEGEGYEVRDAASGEEGLDLFAEAPTDVALIDRERLKQHPGESEFKRLSTEDEIRSNLAPGTDITRFVGVTTVRELAPGVRERIISHTREFRKPE